MTYKVTLNDGLSVVVKSQTMVRSLIKQFVVSSVFNVTRNVYANYKFGI